jgi:Tol biopolymer transport system component
MPEIGQSLSHYSIVEKIGKGGMGEVYKAKDQKLGRDIAIKVLPEEFAKDADRVARFQREAKLLASLNHPNIAAIHGLEESNGTHFLVLELIEGGTLADRIKNGSIPVEESLKLALQIAEALEAAHEKGVIHRDLKPANIKVTPDGKVKVLDFGLAKAFAGEQAELNLSNSPTLSYAATQQGVILGTAAYMSPEQAKGKTVDKKADIWAFGCVLYEMLTGQAAFQGEDVTEILAAVVKGGANLDLLPANLHLRVCEVITRCLQKDLKKRYQDIGDVRYEIEQSLTDRGGMLVRPVAGVEPQKKLQTIFPWAAAALVLGLIIASIAVWTLKATEPRQVMRSEYTLPEGQQFGNVGGQALAVSPDGRQFVYVTAKGLCLRSLNEFDAKLIPGTDTNPYYPFFSPDGKWIGYFSGADSKLKKIAVSGGPPTGLCDVDIFLGGSWSEDDTIVYGSFRRGIYRVSANGGTPKLIVKDNAIYSPQILPDGKSLLFTIGIAPPKIGVQSLQSGERHELFAGVKAQYISTGHVVYALENNLFAVPFDLKTLKVTGEPVQVVEGVYRVIAGFAPQYAVSSSGTLIYMPGTIGATPSYGNTLVWVDMNGKEEPLPIPSAFYIGPRISPDGTRVALGRRFESLYYDTCVWDLDGKILTRLTFGPAPNTSPLWTPDGRIAFTSWGETNAGLFLKSADGTGREELIRPFKNDYDIAGSWSGDGKTLFIEELYGAENRNFRIGALSMEKDRRWRQLLQGKCNYAQPRISPDGRLLAYTSNEFSRNEVYVCTFPDVTGGKWQVSIDGGDSPLWSPDGRELFFRNGDDAFAATVRTDPAFSNESPKFLFRGAYVAASFVLGALELSPWDIHPNGKKFLMIKPPSSGSTTSEAPGPRKINIVVNWFEELKQKVPVK